MMYPVRIVDQGVAVGVVDQRGKQVMVLYGIVLYCTILYYTVLYCSIPYYTVLYCTILYYTVLYRTVQVVEQQGGAGGGARWSFISELVVPCPWSVLWWGRREIVTNILVMDLSVGVRMTMNGFVNNV